MEKDWVLIYSAGNIFQAELLKGRLNDEGIVCDLINKKDSSFAFGDIELYVYLADEQKARAIIDEFEGNQI